MQVSGEEMLKVLLSAVGQSIYFGCYAVQFWVVIKKSCKSMELKIFCIAEVFHSPTDALLLILENSKIYIKTY
jgi:hypothetical protein